jgi:hypothetical protein
VIMEVRVKITRQIVVGANCLSSSPIRSSEWWRCQLSRTITRDYKEDWKHEDSVQGRKGQDHPLNSSWCMQTARGHLLKGAMNDEGASCQELLLSIMKKTGKQEDSVHGSKGQDHPLNSSWWKLPEFISYKELWMG